MCRRGKQAMCDDGGLAVCRGEWRGGDVEEVESNMVKRSRLTGWF